MIYIKTLEALKLMSWGSSSVGRTPVSMHRSGLRQARPKLSVVVHTWDPSALEGQARSQVQDYAQLHSQFEASSLGYIRPCGTTTTPQKGKYSNT